VHSLVPGVHPVVVIFRHAPAKHSYPVEQSESLVHPPDDAVFIRIVTDRPEIDIPGVELDEQLPELTLTQETDPVDDTRIVASYWLYPVRDAWIRYVPGLSVFRIVVVMGFSLTQLTMPRSGW